jgi:Zn-dependent protease
MALHLASTSSARAGLARLPWSGSDRLAFVGRILSQPGPAILLTIAGYSLLGLVAAVLVVAVIVSHELAHWLVMWRLGYRPRSVRILPLLGAYVQAGRPMLRSADIALVYLAGPLAGVLLSALAALLAPGLGSGWLCHQISVGVTASLLLNLCNLIPAEPLDGGLIARALPFKAMLLFPVLVAIWLLAFGLFWSTPGLVALGGALAVTYRAIGRWQRYLSGLQVRLLHGDLTALRELRASLDVPLSERMTIAVVYVLLVTTTLLLLRAMVSSGGFAW